MNNNRLYNQSSLSYLRPQPSSSLYNDSLYSSLSSSLSNPMYKTSNNFHSNSHTRGFSDSPPNVNRSSNWQRLKDEILSPGDEDNASSTSTTNISVYNTSKVLSNKNYPVSNNNYRSSTPSWKKPYSSSSTAFLPYESSNGKKTLILDLDETLVHSAFKPFYFKADMTLNVQYDGSNHPVHVLKRPYVDEFLRKMAEHFEIVVFTASISQYANPLLDRLDSQRVITHRLFREHCVFNRGLYIKDLRKIGRELKDMIIVDNNPISYTVNQDNGIPIPTWHYDKTDTELLKLIPILEFLAYVDDVRSYIKKIVSGNEIDFKIANAIINNTKKSNKINMSPYYVSPSPSYNDIQQRKPMMNQRNIKVINIQNSNLDNEDDINSNQLNMNYSHANFSINKNNFYRSNNENRNAVYNNEEEFSKTGTAFHPVNNEQSYKTQMSYTPKINYRSQMENDNKGNNTMNRVNEGNKIGAYTGTFLNRRHDPQKNNYFVDNNDFSMTTSPNININIVNQNVSNLVLNNERNRKYENILNDTNNDISYRKLYKGNTSTEDKPIIPNNYMRTLNVNDTQAKNIIPKTNNNQYTTQIKHQYGLYSTINEKPTDKVYSNKPPAIDTNNDISLDSSNFTPNFMTINDYQNNMTNTTEEDQMNQSAMLNRSISNYKDIRPKTSLFSSSMSYLPQQEKYTNNYVQASRSPYRHEETIRSRMMTPNRRYDDNNTQKDFYNSRSVERVRREMSPNRRMYNTGSSFYLQERENNLAFGRYNNNINQSGNDYMKYNLQFRRPFAYQGGREYNNYSSMPSYYSMSSYQSRNGEYY